MSNAFMRYDSVDGLIPNIAAAAIMEEGNGYESALVSFRFIASTVWTTEEAVQNINDSK